VECRLEARSGLGEGALELALGGEDRLREISEAQPILVIALLDRCDRLLEEGSAPCRCG